MRTLVDVDNFGGTDADNDELLLRAFEDHEAYLDVLNLKRHLIVGRKGSGKTAIFKRLITTHEPDFFAYGHTFSDYPWHHHDRQARVGIPDFDKYTQSWKFLILMSLAKIALNQDQSIPFDDASLEALVPLEAFIVDTYGSRDPDLSQIFSPMKNLRLKPHLDFDFKILRAGIAPESVPMPELPFIVQEVNHAFTSKVMAALNPANRYFIAFDQLDLGFDLTTPDYANRLIGLLPKGRGLRAFTAVFLRDDIYDSLHFEDKNKMTENYLSLIEWDTIRTGKSLRSLMEKRFSIVLGANSLETVKWEEVFNEDRKMPGHQTKYEHMRDRTFLRPRDMIKFVNSTLSQFKTRINEGNLQEGASTNKIDNTDVHNARAEFSEYFLRELDDEVHKHVPNYQHYLDVLRVMGKWQFEKAEFETAYAVQMPDESVAAQNAIELLYTFSIIGFYRAGGRGFGGSEYVYKYREARVRFDPTSDRFRVHPGLIETLSLKRS
jgi:hypothetical protein